MKSAPKTNSSGGLRKAINDIILMLIAIALGVLIFLDKEPNILYQNISIYKEISIIFETLGVIWLAFIIFKGIARMGKDKEYAKRKYPKAGDRDWTKIFIFFGLMGVAVVFKFIEDDLSAAIFGAVVYTIIIVGIYFIVTRTSEKHHSKISALVLIERFTRIFTK